MVGNGIVVTTSSRSRIAIVTDSTSDLGAEEVAAAGMTMVPVQIDLGDDTALLRALGADEFSGVRDTQGQALPPLHEVFAETFGDLLQNHDAVIAILLSDRLGPACAAARSARALLPDPERVAVIDSRSVSLGLGLQARRVAEMVLSGASLADVVAAAESARSRFHVVFSIENIEHLRRIGRIGRAAAMISEALQLKPLLRIDEGQIVPYERARTRAGAIAELTAFVGEMPGLSEIAVLYATDRRDADMLARDVAAVSGTPFDRIRIARIGPAIAAHVGPGALGIVVEESA
ncbi:MAG: DegV family protein [Thermomicrobiales bacterium]